MPRELPSSCLLSAGPCSVAGQPAWFIALEAVWPFATNLDGIQVHARSLGPALVNHSELGLRLVSIGASFAQLALYGRFGSPREFLYTTTSLALVGLILTVSDPGLGLLSSQRIVERDLKGLVKVAFTRVSLLLVALSAAIVYADHSLMGYLSALSGFLFASFFRTVFFSIYRMTKPQRYEFRVGSLLNLVDSCAAIFVLLISVSIRASLV